MSFPILRPSCSDEETVRPDTPGPGRDFPPCEERDLPWIGNAIPVVDGVPQTEGAEGTAPAGTEPMSETTAAS